MGRTVIVATPSSDGKMTKKQFIETFFSKNHYIDDAKEINSIVDLEKNVIKKLEEFMRQIIFDIEKRKYYYDYILKKYINKFIKRIKPIARSNC